MTLLRFKLPPSYPHATHTPPLPCRHYCVHVYLKALFFCSLEYVCSSLLKALRDVYCMYEKLSLGGHFVESDLDGHGVSLEAFAHGEVDDVLSKATQTALG